MSAEAIVVGAGVSGLALARELRERGHDVLVLERARGVGGRCATRRVDGQGVDHGVGFLHGRDAGFLAAIESLLSSGELLAGWPHARRGAGVPCQPAAFGERERRFALSRGMSAFAKALAVGTPVRVNARVESLSFAAGRAGERTWELLLEGGERVRSRALALTMPAPGASRLLRPLAVDEPAVRELLPLLDLVHPVPCLTVIARYALGVAAPDWDALYPETSERVQVVMNDGAKRGADARTTLVIQARPNWSRRHLQDAPEGWSRALLEETARLAGDWAGAPESAQPHAWRNARVALGSELAAPYLAPLPGGALLGIAGDGWHESGGVEGAYLSGVALAARFHHALVTHI